MTLNTFYRISNIPIRFVFESALELMSETKVGGFEMKGTEGGNCHTPFSFLLQQLAFLFLLLTFIHTTWTSLNYIVKLMAISCVCVYSFFVFYYVTTCAVKSTHRSDIYSNDYAAPPFWLSRNSVGLCIFTFGFLFFKRTVLEHRE